MNLIVLIDKLLINLCIEYKYVLLLQLTEKKITIFLSVGILEHPPLHLKRYSQTECKMNQERAKFWEDISALTTEIYLQYISLIHFKRDLTKTGMTRKTGTTDGSTRANLNQTQFSESTLYR